MKPEYPREECGVIGIYNIEEASNFAYLGIYALQHRGQESAGIVSSNGAKLFRYAGMGRVVDIFDKTKLKQLKGSSAIGHNRYSTTGASFLRNAQPLRFESRFGSIALAHNGNLTNTWSLRKKLEEQGTIFQTTADSEIICHLAARSKHNSFQTALIEALSLVKGAYSLVILTKSALYAARDPNGFRPLVLGRKEEGYVLASETCALDMMDAEYIRDVAPGELLVIDEHSFNSLNPFQKKRESICIFEFVYFSRPDSRIFDSSVYESRYKMGRILARESPVEADVVVPVPDSSNVAAVGFAHESQIPFHMGLIRSHYIGRTFIEPDQKIRDFGVKLKYNPIEHVVKGKRVVIIDDSIMRGTTSKKIIKLLQNSGALEVHLRISSSPSKHPCYYGIDIPTGKELIASSRSIQEIQDYLEVDSLAYLSTEGMQEAGNSSSGFPRGYCMACFDGNYPVTPETEIDDEYKRQKDLFEELEEGK